MKIATATSLVSLSLLGTSSLTTTGVNAFSPVSNGRLSSTRLHATVEQSTTKKLIPPPTIEEVTANAQAYYDNNVQKTYG
jgi:hypothetical protein